MCGIPKVELHLHIEGTLEPELLFQLAEENEQKELMPEHIPKFRIFDPFDDDPLQQIDLPVPILDQAGCSPTRAISAFES